MKKVGGEMNKTKGGVPSALPPSYLFFHHHCPFPHQHGFSLDVVLFGPNLFQVRFVGPLRCGLFRHRHRHCLFFHVFDLLPDGRHGHFQVMGVVLHVFGGGHDGTLHVLFVVQVLLNALGLLILFGHRRRELTNLFFQRFVPQFFLFDRILPLPSVLFHQGMLFFVHHQFFFVVLNGLFRVPQGVHQIGMFVLNSFFILFHFLSE